MSKASKPRIIFRKNRKDVTSEKEEQMITVHLSAYLQEDQKDIAILWIVYKKTYKMVLYSWKAECLKNVLEILQSHQIQHGNHKNWKVKLTAWGKTSADVKIQRDIVQSRFRHYYL